MKAIDSQLHSITPEGRPRRRFTSRDRQRLVRRFEKSGQSAVAFCRDNEVCPSSL